VCVCEVLAGGWGVSEGNEGDGIKLKGFMYIFIWSRDGAA
jgi:hypothetical protein